ncbi:patatin-like phospholipase family protein [Neobacillus sedimentimangrovi]|uniref:Patatin-like phospholipase family protein n=1 Tax=Neobacillus sedimentimangrovi TaxID=2699460 RepID=A0ABS8QG29_9BACI|nr:patatin-like phospholipase family protein [Neobacillus sedimentimangrovi]MCD4838208.1 patatin-like phospholipase family protein [Neobacillus sedimentimangrovi]
MNIDGVFSGGGIKGYALIGACEEIEKRGLKFVRVAGTSAGSIIAALIAAGYTSKEIYQLIDDINISDMLDARKTFLPLKITKWLLLYWRMGLYKGNAFETWIKEVLAVRGVRTFSDLPPNALRIVVSDLSNGCMFILPDDLVKYGISPSSFPVSKAIRMSCSIPYFFEPVKLRTKNGVNILVDGGVLSNFPMWLFDKENIKKVRPVLGIKLSSNELEHEKHKINNAIELFGALFETMKDAHDARYISRKHEKNIIFIPADGVVPIDFHLTDEKKKELIELGKKHARLFLNKWCY